MEIHEDGWLAEILGRPALRVVARAGDDARAVEEHLARARGSEAGAFYFAKIPTSEVALLRALSRTGFFVADVNVVFGAAPAELRASGDVPVGFCRPEIADGVLQIAQDAFRFSRFHLDPLFSKATADAIKRAWIQSYVRGARGDRLFVAELDGRPAGFLAALTTGGERPSAVIDLIATDPAAQRRGVARSLVAAFAAHYRDRARLVVGTQVANGPSVRLYERLGFRLDASQYVLHLHAEGGVPR